MRPLRGALVCLALLLPPSAFGACDDDPASGPREPDAGGGADVFVFDAAAPDAPRSDASCEGSACDLVCDPADTWLAFTRGPGTGQGDADPASPEEVRDGQWHLFLGVNEPTSALPDVYIYDATATAPTATFALPPTPLGRARDAYDQIGSETPSYLRTDDRTEYVYYCGIQSYAPLSSHLAAYARIDGAAWTKTGIVAPNATDELTVCEPNVVRDDASAMFVLRYLSITTANRVQERERRSADPRAFPTSTITITIDNPLDTTFPNRLALSRDPYAQVWRTSYDLTVGNYAHATMQTWSADPSTTPADLLRANVLHDGAHPSHKQLHEDFTTCDAGRCPQGAVLQPSRAVYPSASEVIFYYSGWNTSPPAPSLQVNGQRCRRQ